MRYMLVLCFATVCFNLYAQSFDTDLKQAYQNYYTQNLPFLASYKLFVQSETENKLTGSMEINGCTNNGLTSCYNAEFASWANSKYTVLVNHKSKLVIVSKIKNFDKSIMQADFWRQIFDTAQFSKFDKLLTLSNDSINNWRLTSENPENQVAYYDFSFNKKLGLITNLIVTYKSVLTKGGDINPSYSNARTKTEISITYNSQITCFPIQDWVQFVNDDVKLNNNIKSYTLKKLFATSKK